MLLLFRLPGLQSCAGAWDSDGMTSGMTRILVRLWMLMREWCAAFKMVAGEKSWGHQSEYGRDDIGTEGLDVEIGNGAIGVGYGFD